MRDFLRRIGNWLARHRYLILVLLVAAALALSGFSSYKARESSADAKHATDDNSVTLVRLEAAKVDIADLKAVVAQLRSEQHDSCANYLVLRDAVNLFHSTLDGFLATAQHAREASYKRSHQQSDKRAADIYRQLRAGIRQVKRGCAQKEDPNP